MASSIIFNLCHLPIWTSATERTSQAILKMDRGEREKLRIGFEGARLNQTCLQLLHLAHQFDTSPRSQHHETNKSSAFTTDAILLVIRTITRASRVRGAMAKLKAFWQEWRRVLWRLCKEMTLPILIGIVWGLAVGTTNKSWLEGFSAAGIGFFFVLALQGQFLRITKNVRDDARSERYLDHFASLEQGISALQTIIRPVTPVPATAETPTTEQLEPHTDNFVPAWMQDFASADAALMRGMFRPATVMAALGFEKALEDAAERAGFRPHRTPTMLLRDLRGILTDDEAHELDTLRRLRNNIVHVRGETPSQNDATQLVEAFRSAAARLTTMSNRTGDDYGRIDRPRGRQRHGHPPRIDGRTSSPI